MNRRYLYVGSFVLLFITATHLYTMVTRHNSWPLSSYPMFSDKVSSTEAQELGIMAKTHTGEMIRLPFQGSKLDWFRYTSALKKGDRTKIKEQILFDYDRITKTASLDIKEQLANNTIKQLSIVRLKVNVGHDKSLSQTYKILHSFDL